jgi:hypothetical protein
VQDLIFVPPGNGSQKATLYAEHHAYGSLSVSHPEIDAREKRSYFFLNRRACMVLVECYGWQVDYVTDSTWPGEALRMIHPYLEPKVVRTLFEQGMIQTG